MRTRSVRRLRGGTIVARLLLLALMAVAVSCSPAAQDERRAPPPAATSPGADQVVTAAPEASSPQEPLVLAVHPSLPRLDVSLKTARRVVDGFVRDWRELGAAARPLRLINEPVAGGAPSSPMSITVAAQALREVGADQGALAVVPSSAVGPTVRVITIDGVHPLRQPTEYPLTTPGVAAGQVANVTVVGDIMLGRRVGRTLAASGDFAAALRPMARRLAAADITIGTLESTLSRAGAPRQGGDSFAADPRVLRGVGLAGFDVLSLANNHTGDFGPRALVETVRRVRAGGFLPVGAGANAADAAVPAIVARAGVRFGFLAFNAIGETPRATPRRPGAIGVRMPPRTGPLSRADLAKVQRAILELRSRVDVLIVLPHWGQQYTHRPVAAQRRVGRMLIDAGADLVVGSHPHWVQGAEMHRGGLIVHSLGNFVFDMDFSRQTQEGVVLDLTFWGSRLKAAEFQPVRIGRDFAPRPMSTRASQRVLGAMWRYSSAPFNPS